MLFAVWLRLNLKESPVFEKVQNTEEQEAKTAVQAPPKESFFAMFKSKAFWLATGIRFGQAGNSGLIQTFLAGYLVQSLLFDKSIPTDAIMISSVVGFLTIPVIGLISDKFGRRIPYIILSLSAMLLAYPMLSVIVDGANSVSLITICIIIVHNCSVLGLFALENITMAEMFNSRNRFTGMAVAKEIGGLIASGLGPVLAGIFCSITGSWWPIAIMIIIYSAISLISAIIMPEVKDRDLTSTLDAVEEAEQQKGKVKYATVNQ